MFLKMKHKAVVALTWTILILAVGSCAGTSEPSVDIDATVMTAAQTAPAMVELPVQVPIREPSQDEPLSIPTVVNNPTMLPMVPFSAPPSTQTNTVTVLTNLTPLPATTYTPTAIPPPILTEASFTADANPLPLANYTATMSPTPTPTPVPTPTPTYTPTPTPTYTPTPTSVPSTASVTVRNYAFVPMNVTVEVGKIVTWNFVQGTHTTTGTGSESWNSGNKNDGSFSHTFNSMGTFPYVCNLHSFMTGTVVVE